MGSPLVPLTVNIFVGFYLIGLPSLIVTSAALMIYLCHSLHVVKQKSSFHI